MTTIELSDQQAAVLKAKAEAQGLTLQAWLKDLADREVPSTSGRSAQEAVARILDLQKRVMPDPNGWTVHDYIDYGRP